LIVLIINARNINNPIRSCTAEVSIIGLMFFIRRITASV